jgi:hypothetical protein
MNTRHEHEDLKPLAPTLASIPKVDPFVVPEGLFERFPHQVQARITTQGPALPWSTWVKRLAVALPLVALLAGAWWMLRSADRPPDQMAVEIPETTVDELELLDDPETLASLYESEVALEVSTDMDLSDDELAAWLEAEQTDLSQLIAEL